MRLTAWRAGRCVIEKARDGQGLTFDFSETQRLLLNLNCHLQLIVMDFFPWLGLTVC